MKYIFIYLVVIILSLSFVLADPILTSDRSIPENFECSKKIAKNKEFIANATFIHVGLVCPHNAELLLYELRENTIFTPFNFIDKSYVLNGELVDFMNFEIGMKYYYECHTCKDPQTNRAPQINAQNMNVLETEKIVLDASCSDEEGDTTQLVYSGWMDGDEYTTTFQDAGIHTVTLTCSDDFGAEARKDIHITVRDNNRPPQITNVQNLE